MNNIFPNLREKKGPFKALNPMKYADPTIIRNYSKKATRDRHTTTRGLNAYKSHRGGGRTRSKRSKRAKRAKRAKRN